MSTQLQFLIDGAILAELNKAIAVHVALMRRLARTVPMREKAALAKKKQSPVISFVQNSP